MRIHSPATTPPPALPELQADLPACLRCWPDYALWALARAVGRELTARRLPVPAALPLAEAAESALAGLALPSYPGADAPGSPVSSA